MNPRQCFEVWAPPTGHWTRWAKPVLFAQMIAAKPLQDLNIVDASWAPRSGDRVALVIDLAGVASVETGVSLAHLGYRPVPLFNGAVHANEIVDSRGVMIALRDGAQLLASAALADDAPPAFLIDSGRLAEGRAGKPGDFNNRWIVFPQDFPSGNLLLSRGIQSVMVVRQAEERPGRDLRTVLARWQKEGVAISQFDVASLRPVPVNLGTDVRGRLMGLLALGWPGIRPNLAGGFGAAIPDPSTSGGYS